MAAKLTKLTHKIAIQLHLVAESCTIRSSRSRRPVRKLLDTASHVFQKWVECCKKCIACKGRYFEKETVTAPPQSSDSE
jgi:hypothetical protein